MSWCLVSVGGRKRSAAVSWCLNYEIYGQVLIVFVLIYAAQITRGVTNPNDVAAINNLYATLGNPVLPGWVASAGDPCGEAWQGVQCNNSDILSISLAAANLGGALGDSLGMFASIITIDLTNNHIGGVIPSSLPVTLQNFFLSANQFTGTIPSTLSSLTQLSAMSLNSNLLTGVIPDALEALTRLTNLDLSSNTLNGELPPSLQSLSSLNTLHLQNNQLSGTLDVLTNLPLLDLNVENNLFSGPIPERLLSIPNFRKDGNLFNDTIAPSPPAASPSTPLATSPPSPPFFPRVPSTPEEQVDGPSTSEGSKSGKKVLTTKRVVWISIAGVLLFIILVLGLVLLIQRCTKGREDAYEVSNRHAKNSSEGNRETLRDNRSWVQPPNQMEKVPKEVAVRPKEGNQTWTGRMGPITNPHSDQGRYVQRMDTIPKREDHEIDLSGFDILLMPPPPPPPPPPPLQPTPSLPHSVEKITKPSVPAEATTIKASAKTRKPCTSARSFSIASLQQYTDSFSQDNLIGGGMLGSVYRAQLPDGKLLAVKKMDNRTHQNDDEFIELVDSIDKIRHANVVELAGYCAEHGQRLLIYEYCSSGTLQDALQDDELKNKLSWNVRIRMALGAARALEYLHEICQPPVVHRNFKSVNVLLDDDLAVHIADCGLAPLIASGSVSQLSGQLLSAYGYGAPEFESGIYTYQSDVYSFGVVMLELLTGRMSYDRARSRGEQFLVRWAIPQLHDIDALSRMVDPSLNGVYPSKSLSHFADIISRCVQTEPEFRPLMSEVVQDLLDMIRREPPIKRSNSD